MRPWGVVASIVGVAALVATFNFVDHEPGHAPEVGLWLALPFVTLLAAIAVVPFINRHWWERNYPRVALGLGAAVVCYYVFVLGHGPRVLHTGYEYVSFISLIGSLFVVSGGIHMRIRGLSAPHENVLLLAFGSVIANLLGTTGASMLLIRPYLWANRHRIQSYHVVFFIFLVSNVGGALTPIGDPPLFLGYLKGIPFFWVITRAWQPWLLAMGLLLLAFYAIDSRNFRRASVQERLEEAKPDQREFSGLHNSVFLLVILVAVFVPEHPRMLREIIMWSAAAGSYITTRSEIHGKNDFNFLPIKEVAILFAGIFATMVPALDWLELHAKSLGIVTYGQYFWATGTLSSVLDNAPTYLNFLTAAFGLHGAQVDNPAHVYAMIGTAPLDSAASLAVGALPLTAESWRYVLAISMGAVFFGANTYIGNGPNFMVKSISEQAGVACPTFVGYIWKYSLPILIPVFVIVWLLFFRS
ncbi:MAG: sodium:proton antiporter [Gemmatimonadetes bacterium]|nr:sodium:proton antiporter [Gemmatimonadota bacterium]